MIRSIVVFPDGGVVRRHVGTGRVAARAHRGHREQLLGTQIAHAAGDTSAVGALVISMISSAFGRSEMALAGRPYDASEFYEGRAAIAAGNASRRGVLASA